jgi:predicted esterase
MTKWTTFIAMLCALAGASASELKLKSGDVITGTVVLNEIDFYSVYDGAGIVRTIAKSDVVSVSKVEDKEKPLVDRKFPEFESLPEWPLVDCPPERVLDLKGLREWYGSHLKIIDETHCKRILTAETLISGYIACLTITDRRTRLDALRKLQLDPQDVRAIVRHGPWGPHSDKTGRVNASAKIPGYPERLLRLSAEIPQDYSPAQEWPLLISLHGTHGDGEEYMTHWNATAGNSDALNAGFIVVAPWADHANGWGPSSLGRAQILAAIDWAARHYRIDPDRVCLEGCSMGGAGAKRLAVLGPDRFAAVCCYTGAPLQIENFCQYRNLHDLPLLSLSGAQDPMVPNEIILKEKAACEDLKLPATFVISSDRGHGTYSDTNTDVLAFFKKNARQVPRSINFATQEDGAGLRHYYVEITSTDEAANVPYTFNVINLLKMLDYGRGKLDRQRDLRGALESEKGDKDLFVDSRRMWRKPRELQLHLDAEKNAVVIDHVTLVRSFRIYLNDEMLDLDKEIQVILNGRVLTKSKVSREIGTMLEYARKSQRRDVSYWGEINVNITP